MSRPSKLQINALPDPVLDRQQVVPMLIEHPEEFICVAGLAGSAQELTAITRDGPNVYAMAGAMGAAVSMALGLALAQPKRRVLCVTGDGELLMNLGALATTALMNPPNLTIICVDNGHYGETGNQDSHTGLGVNLARIAEGSGVPAVVTINTMDDLPEGRRLVREGNGLCFILLRVKEGKPLNTGRLMQPAVGRTRFREHLLGHA
jgi:thiamine pyrophosphate-dependent acetolactate synthase large subunit-like protein